MTDTPSCGSCRYWLDAPPEQICRRYPPTVTFLPAVAEIAPRTISYFPGMQASGWCGEWSHKSQPSEVVTFPVMGDGSQKLP